MRFIGSERAGFVNVIVELVGGTVSIPFDVTITLSEQTPVSAKGSKVTYIATNMHLLCLTGGDDFDNTMLVATFGVGMTTVNVTVPVVRDEIIEGEEEFVLTLNVPPLFDGRVSTGINNTTIGVISAPTGEFKCGLINNTC